MARWRSTLWIGSLLAALVLVPTVRAADGRITFAGEIVEPTCALSTGHLASLIPAGAEGAILIPHSGCSEAQGPAAARPASLHALAISPLRAGLQADPLLSYIAAYAHAEGGTARLVTQTYE